MVKFGILRTKGDVWDHKGKCQIAQIYISRSNLFFINIEFLYVKYRNKLVLSDKIGGSGIGAPFHNTVTLDYKTEYITGVSGKYRITSDKTILSSITFCTNKGTYGPFSITVNEGDELFEYDFNYDLGSGIRVFNGFFGTTLYGVIESIGIYVKPPEGEILESSIGNITDSIQINKESDQ